MAADLPSIAGLDKKRRIAPERERNLALRIAKRHFEIRLVVSRGELLLG